MIMDKSQLDYKPLRYQSMPKCLTLFVTIDNQLTQKFYVVDKKFSGWLSRDSFSPMINDKTKDVEIW